MPVKVEEESERLERARELVRSGQMELAWEHLQAMLSGPTEFTNPTLLHEAARLSSHVRAEMGAAKVLAALRDVGGDERIPLDKVARVAGLDAVETRKLLERLVLTGRLGARLEGDEVVFRRTPPAA
ncbi:MAG: hypothetical protein Kow0069_13270 [Promethearchaeota archaeon]